MITTLQLQQLLKGRAGYGLVCIREAGSLQTYRVSAVCFGSELWPAVGEVAETERSLVILEFEKAQ